MFPVNEFALIRSTLDKLSLNSYASENVLK